MGIAAERVVLPPARAVIAAQFDDLADTYDDLPLGGHVLLGQCLGAALPAVRRRALDVGCGTGRTLARLSASFREVHGIDTSRGMLNVADRRLRAGALTNARLALGDVLSLPIVSDSVDLVVCSTTLHHVRPLTRAILELKRVLCLGGSLIVVDILRAGITGRWPVLASRCLAVSCLATDVLQRRPGALRRYRILTGPEWMNHQRGEQFIERRELSAACAEVLPGAQVRAFWCERGFTQCAVVTWRKTT